MKRIGLLGGSFNPVHNGHLQMAKTVLEKLNLDQILFIPTGNNPFKKKQSSKERKAVKDMLLLATQDNEKFKISDIDLKKQEKTFSIDMVKKLLELTPAEYFFVIGSDLLYELESWYKIDELFKLITFVVLPRSGDDKDKIKETVKKLEDKFNTKIIFLKATLPTISSTQIRNNCYLNENNEDLIPLKVDNYIKDNNLYKKRKKQAKKIENFKQILKSSLKPKRYEHSLGVMKTAKELADRFGADVAKAELAGLLHDCAKGLSNEELINRAKIEGINPDHYEIKTLHAPVGEAMAIRDFNIKDPEILSAIRKHTTGAQVMNKLDKIIFLADYIEPNRSQPGVDQVREVAKKDLDQAVLMALNNTIKYLEENNLEIDENSIKAQKTLKEALL